MPEPLSLIGRFPQLRVPEKAAGLARRWGRIPWVATSWVRWGAPLVLLACSSGKAGGESGLGGLSSSGGSHSSSGGASGGTIRSGTGGSSSSSEPVLVGPGLEAKLKIDPVNSIVFVDSSKMVPGQQAYTVKLDAKDVTRDAVFTLDDPSLGTFVGANFTSGLALPGTSLGVSTMVRAVTAGRTAVAKLTVVKLRLTPDAQGKKDFFFTVPYQEKPSPSSDILQFSTNISKVDVAFVMDTTGSMQDAIDNLKSSLSTRIIPAIANSIPSVGLSVVDFRDFADDWVAQVRQKTTLDPKLAQKAVDQMKADGGGDGEEAQLSALLYSTNGQGSGVGLPSVTPPLGTFGAVEFRSGAVPVVVMITDAPWHDPSGTATKASVIAAFQTSHAKFVGVNTGREDGTAWADTFSDAVGSNLDTAAFGGKCGKDLCCTGYSGLGVLPVDAKRCPDLLPPGLAYGTDTCATIAASSGLLTCSSPTVSGYCNLSCGRCPPQVAGPGSPVGRCRLNFDGGVAGDGVSSSIVTAIQAISVGTTYDITARASNDPTNVDEAGKPVDATRFIKSIRAMSEGNAALGCPANPTYDADGDGVDDTFKVVRVGTPVCFDVIPAENRTVPSTEKAGFYNAFIDVLGMPGNTNLGDRRTVVFLVPPSDPPHVLQ